MLIFGEGRGANPTLWSSSSSCSSDFSAAYSADYPYYCGYYAFDLTNTASPVFRWRLQPAAGQEPYWGDPWSKMVVGRVRINGNEKWVGFMGAGYNPTDCADPGDCDLRGKGFFVVDLTDGTVLWGFTRAQNGAMNFSLVGSPAIVDTDYDGFIDTAYLGDLGGNVWRFKFCRDGDPSTCGISDWSGGQVFAASASGDRPIYTTVAVTQDQNANLWVSWGTGDKTDALALPTLLKPFQEKLFAVKDNDRTSTYALGNLEDISSSLYQDAPAKKGWYISLTGSGEKILAEPAFFGGVLYFTTYTPDQTGNPCNQAGTGKLYGIALTRVKVDQSFYEAGGGVMTPPPIPGVPGSGNRSMVVGYGIPTAPVISFKPSGALPPDIYVTTSGGAGMEAVTARVNFNPPAFSSRTNILSWKDRRVQ
jgi:type IV pilus assembly protein PilY1